jgi:flagellar motility protein MotE (MotC chaperone)
LQSDFDKGVLRVREEESANLKKLAKVYAAMSPDSAAAIFGELDDTAVVKIMVFMKDGETAAILESLAKKGQPQAKRAAELSERLRLATYRNDSAK